MQALNRNLLTKFSVINKGVPAINTDDILLQLEDNLERYTPNMVVVMMGINDNRDDVKQFENEANSKTSQCIKSLKIYKLIKLLWLHTLSTAETQTSNNKNINQPYIQNNKQHKDQHKVSVSSENFSKDMQKNNTDGRSQQNTIEIHGKEEEYQKCIESACSYKREGVFLQAIEKFEKAIEINPDNVWPYLYLGTCYSLIGNKIKEEEMYIKALKKEPDNSSILTQLGWCYFLRGDYKRAENVFERAAEEEPKTWWPIFIFCQFCFYQREYEKAEEILKTAIKNNPQDDRFYELLSRTYAAKGKIFLANKYSHKAKMLRRYSYNPITKKNYQKLKDIVLKRGLKHAYPVDSQGSGK